MDYKSIIESKYNRKNWQILLHDIFGSRANLQQQPFHVETSSSLAKSALCLGKITLSDEQTIAVYEVELSDSVDIERNRRGIRDMLASSWRGIHAGAFMFCYRNNESVLRFSYVSESWTFVEDGTYKKESTDTKRFTYLLGEGHRSRTAIQQFEKLRNSPLSLKDLTKAFSVDAVGDMFFKEYKKNYEDIIFYVTGKRMVKVANKWEERQEGKPDDTIMHEFAKFPNPEKAVRDYVKKLMGRLVFLQFLQKKGWLGVRANAEWGTGDAEFIQNLFAQTTDKDHFVDNVLEALFNDLNSEDEKALPQYRTPYLNGGLFERDAQDETYFPLPGKYMDKMLKFFGSYNFTIDENDPDDAEVGVDPEMLGRIFENLLEDNKDKGAFYTPKEIVTYMCRESLIAYLQTDIDDEATKEAIRNFVINHDANQLGGIVNDVDQRLKDVKICDPAIGSGAFPMGLLKELFLCRSAIEGIDQSTAAEIKKHIIQNNIYGVDIEKGAVDIARLRFWLSLIVDEETPQALPNLDFKIMRGNSLLEQYNGFDLSTIMHTKKEVEGPVQMTLFEDNVDVLRRQVIALRRAYFRETNKGKKKDLRKSMRDIVQQQINALSYNIDLSGIDIADNSEFFLWHTWFSDVFENGGFDIVIGNPPYNELRDLSIDFQNLYKKTPYFKYAQGGRINMFQYFYPLSSCILSEKGICSLITQNSLLAEDSALNNRKLLFEKFKICSIDSFPERDNVKLRVFESAKMSVCICIVQKGAAADECFNIHVWKSRYMNDGYTLTMNKKDIQSVYPDDLIFPICTKEGWQLLLKMKEHSDFVINAQAGEIDMTKYKSLFMRSNDDGEQRVVTGAQILRYKITDTPSQGSVVYLNPDMIKLTKDRLESIRSSRIVTQRITGVDSRIRIISTIAPANIYCANSTNYISPTKNNINLMYLLGILNSKCINFYFKQTSTNTNVTGKEIAKLPIPMASLDIQEAIIDKVEHVLSINKNAIPGETSVIETGIDNIVYQLYGLTEEEIKIVEGQ